MNSNRYLPNKYRKDSRGRRLRNRNRAILAAAILLVVLAVAGFFLYHWLFAGEKGAHPVVTLSPSAGVTATQGAVVSASPALSPSPAGTATPEASAQDSTTEPKATGSETPAAG